MSLSMRLQRTSIHRAIAEIVADHIIADPGMCGEFVERTFEDDWKADDLANLVLPDETDHPNDLIHNLYRLCSNRIVWDEVIAEASDRGWYE